MKSKMKIKKTAISMYFVLICTLLNGSVMWRYIVGTPLNFMVLIVLQYVACIFGIISYSNYVPKRCIYVVGMFVVYFGLYCIGTRYEPETFWIYYAGVFICLFVYMYQVNKHNDLEVLFDSFVNIVFIIATLSLFFWLFGSILNVLPGRTLLNYEWANRTYPTYTYYGLYFENPIQSEQILFGKRSVRNSGIYAEVPGYAEVLLYALTIELLSEKKRKYRFIILLMALLSTSSTKGLLVFVIVIIVDYITRKEYKKRIYQIMKFIFSGILVVCGIFVCVYILQDKSQTGSYSVRMDDIHAAIVTWEKYPLFGVGYNNIRAVAQNFQVPRNSDGLSMGLTALLAQGGLYLVGMYIMAVICAIRYASQYRHEIVVFCLMIIVNLFISNSAFSSLMIITLAVAFSTVSNYKNKKVKNRRYPYYLEE